MTLQTRWVIALLLILIVITCLRETVETFTTRLQDTSLQPNKLPGQKIRSSLKPHQHISWARCSHMGTSQIEQNSLDSFKRVDPTSKWDLWFPCGYTYVEKELQENKFFTDVTDRQVYIMAFPGADNLAAKDALWRIFEKRYGRLRAQIYVPETWVTYVPAHMSLFKKFSKEHPNEIYILKKNIQRQEGLKIIHSHHDLTGELQDPFNTGFVVIQRILRDPYLIDGRKINIRIYILITCTNQGKQLYMYPDGFVYYSPARITDGRSDDQIITSGYVDRQVYENNPLTVQDFLRYIDTVHSSGTSQKFLESIKYVLRGLIDAMTHSICPDQILKGGNRRYAQTFGADFQPASDLFTVKLIELNKSPDLGMKDVRDGQLKQDFSDDVYRTLGIVQDGRQSKFIRVY